MVRKEILAKPNITGMLEPCLCALKKKKKNHEKAQNTAFLHSSSFYEKYRIRKQNLNVKETQNLNLNVPKFKCFKGPILGQTQHKRQIFIAF